MVFDFLLAGAFLSVIAVGHFGLWIWLYNRVNATGLNRKTIKRTEKGFVLACGLIPMALIFLELRRFSVLQVNDLNGLIRDCSFLTQAYCITVTVFAIVMAPLWIADRPQLAMAKDRFKILESENLRQLQNPQTNADLYIQGERFRRMAKLPGNQIVSMQRNRKSLYFADLPEDLAGLRIAHLSDVHLTGQLSTSFYRLVVDWVAEQSPDMVVLSGDIVDYTVGLPQIREIFQDLHAPLGNYFILGNHDKRLPSPTDVCRELCQLGWHDLGVSNAMVQRGEASVELLGNELPWFRRHCHSVSPKIMGNSQGATWKVGVAHSPDQFKWGVQTQCSLLLCGHTHGGQIRLPVIGPIISPSWYGARYASGVFSKDSTLMHVSRGVSGVHPFRWGCLPEASLLVLTKSESSSK